MLSRAPIHPNIMVLVRHYRTQAISVIQLMDILTTKKSIFRANPSSYLNPKPNRWIYSSMKLSQKIIKRINIKLIKAIKKTKEF